jgi:DNA-directed RNA polymerase specialized sigma24 family protein
VRADLWRVLQRADGASTPDSRLNQIAATSSLEAIRRIQLRADVRLEASASASTDPTRLEPNSSEERAAILGRCLDDLPQTRRLAVKLHLQRFNSTEIASFLDLPHVKARKEVARGMRFLFSRLARRGLRHAPD